MKNLVQAVAALTTYAGRQDSKEFKEALHDTVNAYASMVQELAMNMREDDDKTSPIKMQITMSCFNEQELASIETFIAAKLEPGREQKRRAKELQMHKMELMKLDAYNRHYRSAAAKRGNVPTGTVTIVNDLNIKTPPTLWQKIRGKV